MSNIKPLEFHRRDGTLRADRHSERQEPQPEGKPAKPKWLRGRASKLWDEYVGVAYWLTAADSHNFAAWCGLAAELERGITKMVASRISQYRMLGDVLGLAGPGSRARINVGNALGKGKDKKAGKEPADKNYA